MMKLAYAALALVISVAGASARPADCLLVVNGKTQIDGQCDFRPNPQGFQILSLSRPLIFGDVLKNDDGTADGYWNEEPGANHAHSSLGEMKREGACWVNSNARICAWKPGEPRNIRSREAPPLVDQDQRLQIPRFDVATHCRDPLRTGRPTSEFVRSDCLSEEQKVYDVLKAKWETIPVPVRRSCVSSTMAFNGGSYGVLGICIEDAEAKKKQSDSSSFKY